LCVQAEEVAFSAEGIEAVFIDGWGCERALGGVAFEVESAFVCMSPDFPAGICIEAINNILVGVRVIFFSGIAHSVEHISADDDGGTGRAEKCFPEGLYEGIRISRGGTCGEGEGFVGYIVVVWAVDVGPVICVGEVGQGCYEYEGYSGDAYQIACHLLCTSVRQ